MASQKEDFSFQRRLEKEAEHWFEEGIITPEQKSRILQRYRLLQKAEEKAGPAKLITTVSILGALLVGIGIILFIASNWSLIPRWGKLLLIFLSLVGSYGFGFYFRFEKGNYPKVGASLILLGSLIFGAGIFLIAQIYHLKAHEPNGLLLWAMGVLPLGYCLHFKSLISLGLIDLLIWLGMEASSRMSHVGPEWAEGPLMILLFWTAGLTLWAIGLWHREWKSLKPISTPFILAGALLSLLVGFILTFFRAGFLEYGFAYRSSSNLFIHFYPALLILFFIAVIFRYLPDEKERGWRLETTGLLFLLATALVLSFYQKEILLALKRNLRLIFNLLFALEVLGLIYLGFLRRYSVYVNIGLLFFSLGVVARYFDIFWGLLPRSLFFILGGLLLLFGGIYLERKRRKVLASFRLKEVEG